MDPWLVGRGAIFGFSIAASVGPMWLLCARRTLSQGRAIGLLSGLGVATADACYGAVAALGLTAITTLLVEQRMWLRLFGGFFLCYLGLNTLRTQAELKPATVSARGLFAAYVSTLGLTLSNPATILAFIGIFAGLGLSETGQNVGSGISLVCGVFLGSASWWIVLTVVIERLRSRLTPRLLRGLNTVSGVLIVAFGVVAIAAALAG